MQLYEKYRPTKWEEVVGHAKIKTRLIRMALAGDVGGRAFLLAGSSGIGKSTIAYLAAVEVCDEDNILELDGTKVTADRIDKILSGLGQLRLGVKPGKAIIINECHKLNGAVIGRLLTALERIPQHVVFIFTTQAHKERGLFDDDDSGALESRCLVFNMKAAEYTKGFAERAQQIAKIEGLENGQDLKAYVELAVACEYNFRKMLSTLDAGEFMPEDMSTILEKTQMSFLSA